MDEKSKLLGNFEKILKFFDENSLEKLNFLFFNFYFLFFSENLLLKIELSEITPFFYNNFFGFWGGGNFPPFPPGYALAGQIFEKVLKDQDITATDSFSEQPKWQRKIFG